jgi:hypothetical protein
MSLLSKLVLFALPCVPALACSCVYPMATTARTQMTEAAVVFRGTVIERKVLPRRPELRRGRYAITFRVNEYWKGSPAPTIVIYGVDPGTDCMGWGDVEVGKAYLLYADEQEAKDYVFDDYFWIGWEDVLPKGAKMLVPGACTPGGEISNVKSTLRELGKGKRPEQRNP